MTYREWLKQQSGERVVASFDHMLVCRKLGDAHRSGDWQAAADLTAQVQAHYARWPA